MPAEPSTDPDTVVADFELTRSLAIQFTLVGTLGFVVALGLLGGLYQVVTGDPAALALALSAGWWNGALAALAVVVLLLAVLPVHEWIHGLAIRYYGGEPRYGVGLAHFVLPYAYATTDHRFTRNQFVVVLLAPLVAITAVGVPVVLLTESSWLIVPLAANAGGAVVDLWMTLVVASYPARVQVEDHATGLRILGRPGDGPVGGSGTALVWDAVVGAAAASVGLFATLGVLGPLVLSALGIESLSVGREGTVTFVFAYTSTADEVSIAVGVGVLVLGGLLGLAYGFVRAGIRRRSAAAGPPQ